MGHMGQTCQRLPCHLYVLYDLYVL